MKQYKFDGIMEGQILWEFLRTIRMLWGVIYTKFIPRSCRNNWFKFKYDRAKKGHEEHAWMPWTWPGLAEAGKGGPHQGSSGSGSRGQPTDNLETATSARVEEVGKASSQQSPTEAWGGTVAWRWGLRLHEDQTREVVVVKWCQG
jgi:hypothetical protein